MTTTKINLTPYEDGFVEMLKKRAKGSEHKITAKVLEDNGWGTPPEIRVLVHRLRIKGVPICSNNRGYWYPKDINDLNDTLNFLESMSTDLSKVIDALTDTYLDMAVSYKGDKHK